MNEEMMTVESEQEEGTVVPQFPSKQTQSSLLNGNNLSQRKVHFNPQKDESFPENQSSSPPKKSPQKETSEAIQRRIQRERDKIHEENVVGVLGLFIGIVVFLFIAGSIPIFVFSAKLGENQPFLYSSSIATARSYFNYLFLPFGKTTRLFPQMTYLGLVMLGTGAFYFVCLVDFMTGKILSLGYLSGIKEKKPIHSNLAAGIAIQLIMLLPLNNHGMTNSIENSIIIIIGITGIIFVTIANILVNLAFSKTNDYEEEEQGDSTSYYSSYTFVRWLVVLAIGTLYFVGIVAIFAINIYILSIAGVWYSISDVTTDSYSSAFLISSSFINMVFVVVMLTERFTERINVYFCEMIKLGVLLLGFLLSNIFVLAPLNRDDIIRTFN